MAWENANQIFHGQPIQLPNNLGAINPNDLPNSNINSLSMHWIKPTKNDMIENILEYTYFKDNSIVKKYIYNVFPEESIDGIPMFNIYGCKIYNDEENNI